MASHQLNHTHAYLVIASSHHVIFSRQRQVKVTPMKILLQKAERHHLLVELLGRPVADRLPHGHPTAHRPHQRQVHCRQCLAQPLLRTWQTQENIHHLRSHILNPGVAVKNMWVMNIAWHQVEQETYAQI